MKLKKYEMESEIKQDESGKRMPRQFDLRSSAV